MQASHFAACGSPSPAIAGRCVQYEAVCLLRLTLVSRRGAHAPAASRRNVVTATQPRCTTHPPSALSPIAPAIGRGQASAIFDSVPLRIASKATIMNTINNSPTNKNLVDTAAANGSFKTFGKAIDRAGMADTLRGAGPFTVFAPTDAAFEKLPAGKLDNLFKPENKEELVSLLNYHVVSGRKTVADVGKWDAARTVNGQSAPIVFANDQVSIDGALVTSADIGSSNGVIHGIDKVNIPTKQ